MSLFALNGIGGLAIEFSDPFGTELAQISEYPVVFTFGYDHKGHPRLELSPRILPEDNLPTFLSTHYMSLFIDR